MFGTANSGNSGMNNGGLFGNKPAGTNTGFQFGGQQQQQQQQQPAGGNTGLFGQNTNSLNNSGSTGNGLFGNNQQQKPATGGLFGNNNNATGTTSGATGGGLFGNQQTNTTTGGGLFGAKPSGGLFGNTQQQQQQQQQPSTINTGGGLFGNNNNNSNTTTGGLFGNNSNANGASGTSGGLFGGNKGPGATSGGLFGNANPNASTTTSNGGGLFGTSLFGSSASNTMQPSFAWSNNQQQQQPQQQLPSVQQPQQQLQIQQQQQQQQMSNYPQQIQEQILKCKESWLPTEQRSKLKTFVYNKCTETEAMLYNKPVSISQEDWDQALMSKPANNTIPIRLLGFQDLNERNQLQKQHVAQARVLLGQILEKLNQVNTKHDLDTQSRIAKAVSRNTVIENRILKLASQLAVLKSKNLPLSLHEEEMMSKFDKLLQESNDPAGLGKNNELWARLSVLKERAKNISEQLDSTLVVISENGGSSENSKKNNQDEELEDRVNKIAEMLSNQQRGLCFLNDVLEKDVKLVDEVQSKLKK
ncbi:hypothetical protein C6P43_000797 [Kluyveromyces marxianus]|nr:hypothetical protein C6P43_000797 [Kluyveromyces marxianus]